MTNAKKYSVKKGKGTPTTSRAYPVKVCSTRYKDSVTGKWTSAPKDAPKAGTVRRGARVNSREVVTRFKDDDGEVQAVRVSMPNYRAAQRMGKISLAAVRETEKEAARDKLAELNPRRASEIDLERMHEAHNSDKAKRGAATKKKNKALGHGPKVRPVQVIQTQLLRTEELVKDAQRRHSSAKTQKAKSTHAATLRSRRNRLTKLRAELAKAAR